jgi:hypothetical protein
MNGWTVVLATLIVVVALVLAFVFGMADFLSDVFSGRGSQSSVSGPVRLSLVSPPGSLLKKG